MSGFLKVQMYNHIGSDTPDLGTAALIKINYYKWFYRVGSKTKVLQKNV